MVRRRFGIEVLEGRALLAGFVVTSAGDDGDNLNPTPGSLRAAIVAADADPSPLPFTISFNIPGGEGQTIAPTTSLPTLIRTTIVDATTQPGYAAAGSPVIALNGYRAGNGATGLVLGADSSVIRGFSFGDFGVNEERRGAAIALLPGASHATIEGNWIGILPDGMTRRSNYVGILVNSSGNTIGGTTAAARNVISGNNAAAVSITGTAATGNLLEGNLVGPDASGSRGVGFSEGVIVETSGNTIGGTSAAARNVIAGNYAGVDLSGSGATGNLVVGNRFGLDASGTMAINNYIGVLISGSGNTIGGTSAGSGNLISGNAIPAAGFGAGITLQSSATGNSIEGNTIGLDASGRAAVGNDQGIVSRGSSGNTIGGTATGAGNTISGNILGIVGSLDDSLIAGNTFGLDTTGVVPVGNGIGVSLTANRTTIGGSVASAGNVIVASGKTAAGIGLDLTGDSDLVVGNNVGTTRDGASNGGLNNVVGMRLHLTQSTVGGTTAAARNIVSENLQDGIILTDSTGVAILGNVIGGNIGRGIAVVFTSPGGNLSSPIAVNDSIGGTTAGAGNLIAGNGGSGVALLAARDLAISGLGIRGNAIATNLGLPIDLDGTGIPERSNVILSANVANNQVTLSGVFAESPSTTYEIDLFANPNEVTGSGNALVYLGTVSVTTDAGGVGRFTATYPLPSAVINSFSRTITGPAGNTSEYSVDSTSSDLAIQQSIAPPSGVVSPGQPPPIHAGDAVQLTETITNNGPATASGITFTVALPASLTSVRFSNTGVTTSVDANNVVTATVASLAPGNSFTVVIDAVAATTGTFTLDPKLTSATINPYPGDESSPLTVTILPPVSDLVVATIASLPTIHLGDSVTYLVTATNNGPNAAPNVTIADALPTGVRLDSATPSQGQLTIATDSSVVANVGTLAAGQSATILIVVTPLAVGSTTNQATTASDGVDPNTANNAASVRVDIAPAVPPTRVVALRVSIAPATPTATVGQAFSLLVTVTNDGPDPATHVVVTTALDSPGLRLTPPISQPSGGYLGRDATIATEIETLAAGESRTLTITFTPTASGTISTATAITADQTDPTTPPPLTLFSISAVNPSAAPNVGLVLAESVFPAGTNTVGQFQIFTMTVSNTGTDPATNATLVDALPAGSTFVNAAPSQGGFATLASGILTENFGTILPGASATLTLVVIPNFPGVLTNFSGAYSPDVLTAPTSFAYGSVSVPSGPSVVGIAARGNVSALVVFFDEALEPTSATNKRTNVKLVSLSRTPNRPARTLTIRSITYDDATRSVTITPTEALDPSRSYQIILTGAGKNGITDRLGRRLVFPQYGLPGATYSAIFVAGDLPRI